jgi:DNA transformation protein
VDDLSELPNIGATLSSELEKAGIASYDELVDVGSVEATLRVARGEAEPCYNKLYALEGAIRGVRWHSIPKEERARLKEQYDRARSA